MTWPAPLEQLKLRLPRYWQISQELLYRDRNDCNEASVPCHSWLERQGGDGHSRNQVPLLWRSGANAEMQRCIDVDLPQPNIQAEFERDFKLTAVFDE